MMKISRCCTNLIITVLLGFASGAHHPVASQVVEKTRAQVPAVANKTRALQVVSFKPIESSGTAGQAHELVLKNASPKRIDAYSIAYGENSTVGSDFIDADRLIAPGEQFTEIINSATKPIITYAIFEDGSIDGDVSLLSRCSNSAGECLSNSSAFFPCLQQRQLRGMSNS